MSDNSHSAGSSSGSSTNSWTLLSPEEAAVENVGPVDDGTESLGDAPSLSEDLTGAAVEFKPSDSSVETVLSEEGHQVCQETSPEASEGPVPSSPPRMSPLTHGPADPPDLDVDLESQPPVIHDIVTSSPGDNEPLGATPIVSNIHLGGSLDLSSAEEPLQIEPEVPVYAEQEQDEPVPDIVSSLARESPVLAAEPEVEHVAETLKAEEAPSHVEEDVEFAGQGEEETQREVVESVDDQPEPETIGSVEAEVELETAVETVTQGEIQEEEEVIQEEVEEEVLSSSLDVDETSGFDDGLRRRNLPPFDGPRPRTSDEDEEDEDVEFRLAEKKEDKPFLSLNKCIVGSLILLFLGSLFLSGFLPDLDDGDFDGSELSDGEQSQDWLSGDPQDMKELLDKLTQENQKISQLEAQLQTQKQELDSALKALTASGDVKGHADLEKENAKLKEELLSLPELKKELESLRVRVTELSLLTDDQEMPTASAESAAKPGAKDSPSDQKVEPERRRDTADGAKLNEELLRQKGLLEESRKRLQGMKKNGGDRRRRVRDSLEEIQRKLSEQVDRWDRRKQQEGKWKGYKKDAKWAKESDGWKGSKEEAKKEWKKPESSHKEAWTKHQDEWERRKPERKTDRDDRRKEKSWFSKNSHNHHGHHGHHPHQHHLHQHPHKHQHQQPPRQHAHTDFWKDQEQKLKRNIHPKSGCVSPEDCAAKEGLYPVELPEFEELLEGYLSKLEGVASAEAKDKIRRLTAEFFLDSVFVHHRVRFADFAEDVADILEDMVDVLHGDNHQLEEEMEEFEREALWKFAATA